MINSPFNYTGSKFKILDQLLPHFDYSKSGFVDVFAGGGSVYTNVVDKYDFLVVNDIISDLIECHKGLFTEEFVELVKKNCVRRDDQEGYHTLRDEYNNLFLQKRPHLLLSLMLCCTNNMMRFNKSFKFNQTFGKRGWSTQTEEKISRWTNHLRPHLHKIKYISTNFKEITPVTNNFFFYYDPPYSGKSESGAGYNCFWNNKTDDELLYHNIKRVDSSGCTFVLSNTMPDNPEDAGLVVNKLLADGYKMIELQHSYDKVSRNKGKKLGKEIIIKNF